MISLLYSRCFSFCKNPLSLVKYLLQTYTERFKNRLDVINASDSNKVKIIDDLTIKLNESIKKRSFDDTKDIVTKLFELRKIQ